MNGSFAWQMPVAVQFGVGCVDRVPAVLGDTPIVMLHFEGAADQDWSIELQAALGARLRATITCPDRWSSMSQARELSATVWPALARHRGCVLMAIGGGTVLDLAKVLRCRPLDGDFDSLAAALRGSAAWPAQQIERLWLVPTTAGTGSEVTRWATLWDDEHTVAVKRSLDEPFGYAERAFVDPALTVSCPKTVTRDSAIDALSHALESIWNCHANPLSDALAVTAARGVLETLPRVLRQSDDLALRTELALAALRAGLAFSQTRTALAHALSYALTLEQGLTHGVACAVWLPAACRLAAGRNAHVDRQLAEIFGCAAAHTADRLHAWLSAVGVDADPKAHGIDDGDARIEAALRSTRGRNFIGAPA